MKPFGRSSRNSPPTSSPFKKCSKAGARRILGDEYSVEFESRYTDLPSQCESDADDIFTAIAYKRELEPFVTSFQIDALAIAHQSACSDEPARKVRGGVGIKSTRSNKTYPIPSLHLKASCKQNTNANTPDLADDRATLAIQFDQLIAWMKATEQRDDVLMLAGDFNRQLLSRTDKMRIKLLESEPDLIFHPTENRTCWQDVKIDTEAIEDKAKEKFPEIAAVGGFPLAFTPRANQRIDHFVIRGLGEPEIVETQQVQMGVAQRLDEPGGYRKHVHRVCRRNSIMGCFDIFTSASERSLSDQLDDKDGLSGRRAIVID